ncbi:MAG: translocation/assembly module TamB domain-containing protein [Planctomycetota bacterium]
MFVLRRPLFGGALRGLVHDELVAALGTEVALEPIGATGGRGSSWSCRSTAPPSRSRASAGPGSASTSTLEAPRRATGRAPPRRAGRRFGPGRHARRDGRGEAAGGEPDLEGALAPLLGWLPDGAVVRVGRFRFGSTEGPMEAVLTPAAGGDARPRKLAWTSPRLDLDLVVGSDPTFRVQVRGQVRDVGSLVHDVGMALDIEGGEGELSADMDARGRASGSLVVTGMRSEGRVLDRTALRFVADPHRLDVPELTTELPGLRISAGGLSIPLEGGGAPIASGPLDVEVRDLTPYAEWLPGPVRERLPIEGRVTGRLTGGRLEISEARLTARGASATLDAGNLPLSRTPGRFEGSSLSGRVELAEPITVTLGPLGTCRVTGSFDGRVHGSLDDPVLDGRLEARVGHDRGTLLVSGVLREREGQALDDLSLGTEGDGLPAAALGGSLVLAGDRLGFALRGDLDLALLEALGLGPALPIPLVVSGLDTDGSLDLAGPKLAGKLTIAALRTGERPLGRLEAELDWEGGEALELARLELVPAGDEPKDDDEATRIRARGTLALGPGAEHSFTAETRALPLALLRPWLDPTLPDGSLDLEASLGGRSDDPRLRAEGTLRCAQAWEPLQRRWPERQLGVAPAAPYALSFAVARAGDGLTIERLSASSAEGPTRFTLEGRGVLPFGGGAAETQGCSFDGKVSLTASGELPLTVGAHLTVDRERAALAELVVETAQGRATGAVEARGPVPALLTGRATTADLALAGDLQLADLPLASLPPTWIGARDVDGRLDGHLELGGTLADPDPRARLVLRDVACLVSGIPKLEGITGEVVVEERAIRVDGLTGKLGGGPFTLKATASTPGPLWQHLDEATVEGSLVGKDLLLFRGQGLIAIGSAELSLSGRTGDLLVGGAATIDAARYSRHHSLMAFQPGARGGASVGGFTPFFVPGAFGRGLRFDVAITTAKPMLIRAGVVDCDLSATVALRGTGERPYFIGTIRSGRGVVRLPGANLRLLSALISFEDRNPFDPELEVQCLLRRKGYSVRVRVTGTYLRPALQLESSPSLEYDEILVFLMTGELPKDLQGRELEGSATAAGIYAMGELWSWLNDGGDVQDEEETFFSRFSVQSGQDFGDRGTESIRVEYKMSPNWYLQVEREADGYYNLGLVYRLWF